MATFEVEDDATHNPMRLGNSSPGPAAGSGAADAAKAVDLGDLEALEQLDAAAGGGSSGGGEPPADEGEALLSDPPENWHMATLFAFKTDDADLRRRAPLMFAGAAFMVIFQTLCIIGVAVGTMSPSCASNMQCNSGNYCFAGFNRCEACGYAFLNLGREVTADGDVLNDPNSDRFVGYNTTHAAEFCEEDGPNSYMRTAGQLPGTTMQLEPQKAAESWCAACVHTTDHGEARVVVDPFRIGLLMAEHITAMGLFDCITLIFASFFVAMGATSELQDIQIFELALLHSGTELHGRCRMSLVCLNFVRRWVFLPSLVTAVPTLVVLKGGDALNVCMNTVAVMFLTEVDEGLYAFGLSSAERSMVEDGGRTTVSCPEQKTLRSSKWTHALLIMVSILSPVIIGPPSAGSGISESTSLLILMLQAFVVFWMGGLAEATVANSAAGGTAAQTALAIARKTAASMAGVVMFLVLYAVAVFLA